MGISLHKHSKFVCLAMALIMALGIFLSAGTSVYASTEYNSNKQLLSSSEQTKFAKNFENDLNFIMQNATIYDEDGNVQALNFDVLYTKFGHTTELTQLEEQVNKDIQQNKFKRANAKQCAITAIQDTLGVSAVGGLISGGIVGLLQQKAAVAIAKLISKYAFKGLVPGVAAASLIWSFGRCMWF